MTMADEQVLNKSLFYCPMCNGEFPQASMYFHIASCLKEQVEKQMPGINFCFVCLQPKHESGVKCKKSPHSSHTLLSSNVKYSFCLWPRLVFYYLMFE